MPKCNLTFRYTLGQYVYLGNLKVRVVELVFREKPCHARYGLQVGRDLIYYAEEHELSETKVLEG